MTNGQDRLFAALANPHRREIVVLLALQPFSISRLADARRLSLPAINKHVGILEDAGLVTRRKLGRTTYLALDRRAILDLQAWISQFHAFWGSDRETHANYERYLAVDPATAREKT